MEFVDLVMDRRTIRTFLPEAVSDGVVREILTIATHACNSGNEQLWQFIAIRSQDLKARISQTLRDKADDLLDRVAISRGGERPAYNPQAFFLEAPVVLAVATAGKAYRTKPDLLMLEAGFSEMEILNLRSRGDLQTLGAVIQLILLAAWERGLGGCWMTGPLYARKELEDLVGLGRGEQLAALIPLGLPAAIPEVKGRKPLEEVLRFV